MSDINGLNERGARILVLRLTKYWHERGYKGFKATAIATYLPREETSDNISEYWVVRSNIGPRGYPPKEVAT